MAPSAPQQQQGKPFSGLSLYSGIKLSGSEGGADEAKAADVSAEQTDNAKGK